MNIPIETVLLVGTPLLSIGVAIGVVKRRVHSTEKLAECAEKLARDNHESTTRLEEKTKYIKETVDGLKEDFNRRFDHMDNKMDLLLTKGCAINGKEQRR